MLVLQSDQHPLEWPHERQAEHDRQRQPNQKMKPYRPTILDLDDERPTDHDEADEQDDERHRSIAAVLRGQIEAAYLTSIDDLQKATEQAALTTPRAATAETGSQWRRLSVAHTAGCVVKLRLPPHQYTHTNRNSQTTSTKCQYQAANSKPRC